MASSVNKVILVGNLGTDVELRVTQSGKAVGNFRMATNGGDRVDWHRIVVFDKLAESCAEYLAKGRQVYVEGRIQYRKYQDAEGNDRYSTEIIAGNVQFLGGGQKMNEESETPVDFGQTPEA